MTSLFIKALLKRDGAQLTQKTYIITACINRIIRLADLKMKYFSVKGRSRERERASDREREKNREQCMHL